MPPYDQVLVSLGLDGTVISIYDDNISLAVESMQGYPARLMREAMQKQGKTMQSTTITYPELSRDFLSPMRYYQKLIAWTYTDIWSKCLTYDNVYSDAVQKLYRSRDKVSADRANIETTLAIHEIGE